MVYTEGNWLNQYVSPKLLDEFQNMNDDFINTLGSPDEGAKTADGLKFNKLANNVGFFVNNTAPFTPNEMPGGKGLVVWETYDTDPTEVSDAEMRALAFDKRSSVRTKHSERFKMGFRDHAIWKLAPSDATNVLMPVMRTTGANDGNGRNRLTFEDLVNYLQKVKALNLADMTQVYMVLCPDHSGDLLLDTKTAAYFSSNNVFFDTATGKVKSVLGFKLFENNACVSYTSASVKKAKGAALGSTDRYASVFYYAPNTVQWINSVKVLYKPETTDTRNASPTSEFRLQAFGIVDRIQDVAVGALISGIASASSPTIHADVSALSFIAAGEAKVVEISCVNNTSVSITGTGFTKAKDGQTITVTAAANVGAARTGTLRITDVVTGGYIEIALSQLAGN